MFDSGHYAAPAILILTLVISLLGMYQAPNLINKFLERFLGTTRFVILYFVGLVISHACTWYKEKGNPQYASLGASGAISAVLFAYIVYFPTTTLFIIPFPFPIPAVLFAVGYVAWSWWASKHSRDRINHDAHLCGAISGVGFVAAIDPGAFPRLLSTLF
jgi:membrane associated rhomboid family serine protease